MKFAPVMVALISMALAACDSPGQRSTDHVWIAPSQVSDFTQLYAQNCSGCHGADGRGGASTDLHDPIYLEIANDATIRRVTAEGVPGTAMPAFAEQSGGILTDAQIGILVNGIRNRWSQPGILANANPPAYAAASAGDPHRGEVIFREFCSSCHGADGRGSERASSIVDRAYLSLVSDQHLRTTVIVGLPSLHAPDWRSDVPGKPLSDAEVTDVVAWLASKRPAQSISGELTASGGTK